MPFTTPGMLINANQYSTQSTGETASLVSGSSPLLSGGKLLGLLVTNASGSAAWAQVFDGYAAPAGGSVPILNIGLAAGGSAFVGAGQQNSLDCSVFNCIDVKNGIVIVLSSTLNTYTAVSSGLVTFCAWIQ